MANGAMQEACQETSGFLFSHRCGERAFDRCAQCHKAVCAKHLSPSPSLEPGLCTSCMRQELAQNPDASQSTLYRDHPYFYSQYHYGDTYGVYTAPSMYDPDDFTEGDEAILRGDTRTGRDVEGFEDNMGAS